MPHQICLFDALQATEPEGAEAESEVRAPRVVGNPLDLRTAPSMPKPTSWIEILESNEPRLRLEDRKLINVLIALALQRLVDPTFEGPFRAPTHGLRRAIGQETQRGNIRLRQSLDRLQMTRVRFPHPTDPEMDSVATLLGYHAIRDHGGIVEWDFLPWLRPHLVAPTEWARLHLDVCAHFRSKYALVLYEHLARLLNRRTPYWVVEIDRLRAFLACQDRMQRFSNFNQKILIPSVAEIEESAAVRISVDPLTGIGGSTERLRFGIWRREAR